MQMFMKMKSQDQLVQKNQLIEKAIRERQNDLDLMREELASKKKQAILALKQQSDQHTEQILTDLKNDKEDEMQQVMQQLRAEKENRIKHRRENMWNEHDV